MESNDRVLYIADILSFWFFCFLKLTKVTNDLILSSRLSGFCFYVKVMERVKKIIEPNFPAENLLSWSFIIIIELVKAMLCITDIFIYIYIYIYIYKWTSFSSTLSLYLFLSISPSLSISFSPSLPLSLSLSLHLSLSLYLFLSLSLYLFLSISPSLSISFSPSLPLSLSLSLHLSLSLSIYVSVLFSLIPPSQCISIKDFPCL